MTIRKGLRMNNKPITIAGTTINPGEKKTVLLHAPEIYTQTKVDVPAHVFHGKKSGPKIFIIGTIHGDELNSIEIIRRVHHQIILKKLHGTLITIPIANVYGLILQSRYLPDRRDLNRSFPGSKKGSLASRLARVIIDEAVSQCHYGIDLHTGGLGRINMPQLRVNLDTPGAEELARAFDTPVILDAKLRDGSLREAASALGIPLLVYEAGEALRFNELCIRAGVRGVLNVLNFLKMLSITKKHPKHHRSVVTKTSRWVRSPASGLLQPRGDILTTLTKGVKKGEVLAHIHDPFLIKKSINVEAPFDGIVIGQALKPLVNEGEGLFHIASVKKIAGLSNSIEEYTDEIFNFID